MTSEPHWLASRDLLLVRPDGTRVSMYLKVGQPYEVSAEEWACAAVMEGLHEKLGDIRGIDAWQALHLALRLQRQLLGYALEDGSQLLCHEPPEQITLDELFSLGPT